MRISFVFLYIYLFIKYSVGLDIVLGIERGIGDRKINKI